MAEKKDTKRERTEDGETDAEAGSRRTKKDAPQPLAAPSSIARVEGPPQQRPGRVRPPTRTEETTKRN